MCKEVDDYSEEESGRIPEGIPEPGKKPAPVENPLCPKRHLTKFSTQRIDFDGKDELPEIDLSEVSGSQ